MFKPPSQPICIPGNCCSEKYYEIKPEHGKPIKTWNELLKFYRKSEKDSWGRRWVFRGHKDGTWCLETSLERAIRRQLETPFGKAALQWEHKLLRQFERVAPMFLSQSPGKDSWMEWLALMRHHGGPARLLDWTYSFLLQPFKQSKNPRMVKNVRFGRWTWIGGKGT